MAGIWSDKRHDAEIAGGTGLALGTPAASRAELAIQRGRVKRIDRKITRLKSTVPSKPTQAQRQAYPGYTKPEPKKAKAARQIKAREVTGKVNDLNRARKSAMRARVYNNQTKLWGVGLATGVPLAWHGAHNHKAVSKKWTQKDSDRAVGGAAAGFVGYQGGSLALKPLEKPAERKIKASPTLQGILREHRKTTLPHNAPAGHPGWRKFNREYPKSLPGWQLKRANAAAVSGKSGGAATLAVMGATGYAAVNHGRKKSQIKKSTTSAFGVDHE